MARKSPGPVIAHATLPKTLASAQASVRPDERGRTATESLLKVIFELMIIAVAAVVAVSILRLYGMV